MIDLTPQPVDEHLADHLTPEGLEAEEREWEARLNRLAYEASTANPPRRFTICNDYPRTNDDIVYALGLAHDHGAVVWRGSSVMFTQSAERALRFYSRIAPARLVWLDPDPSEIVVSARAR
jgi:hypothetical protein